MRIGDLLFCWQQTARPSIGRAASWNPPVKIDTAIGWKQAPSEIWYGYPLQEGRIDHWQYWLLGELVGPVESQLKRLFSDLTVADGLNGHFLIIAFNHESRQWHIWTDRLGTLHAYYSRNESRAALGTFCPAVAATTDNYTLDWYGIAGFFSWGFFPQDHTQFANVRILRPAIHLVLDAHGKFQSEERYWRWQHVPDRKRSFADTVTEFAN
ncbi:MAG: hypothetical protein KDE09_21630, partial [Anaerolineales bacterium]|nr:hypothetical protein [Anaerolineales bacterium]